MKKFVLGITISACIALITIFVLSKNKNVENEDIYYTIPRNLSYHYEKNKKMSFDIFMNNESSLIEFPEENSYFLVEEQNSYQLNGVEVRKEKDYISSENVFYKYTITCDLLHLLEEDMIFKDCYLQIQNDTFTLEVYIGYVEIFNEEYSPLVFTDLYGNYAYVQGELHLIGITIQLDSSYKRLKQVIIGNAFVPLSYIEQDQLYDSERLESSLKHSVIMDKKSQEEYSLNSKQNYYFMPISYPKLALITSGCVVLEIDGEKYYIEDFTYLANDISIASYPHIKREGKIVYA